jgi:hypothetical protein
MLGVGLRSKSAPLTDARSDFRDAPKLAIIAVFAACVNAGFNSRLLIDQPEQASDLRLAGRILLTVQSDMGAHDQASMAIIDRA